MVVPFEKQKVFGYILTQVYGQPEEYAQQCPNADDIMAALNACKEDCTTRRTESLDAATKAATDKKTDEAEIHHRKASAAQEEELELSTLINGIEQGSPEGRYQFGKLSGNIIKQKLGSSTDREVRHILAKLPKNKMGPFAKPATAPS